MGRGRRDQALRRRLALPWAAHRTAGPRQAERPAAAGNPPPFPGLRARAGSTGRLPRRAEPPHPRRVTPPGGNLQRIRDDRAVRSLDSRREILRAAGLDQQLRTSAPGRAVRLPRHVPDLPAGELPLKLAAALTVPCRLSSIHAQRHPIPGQEYPPLNALRQRPPMPAHDAPPAAADRGVLAEAYRDPSGSPPRRARGE